MEFLKTKSKLSSMGCRTIRLETAVSIKKMLNLKGSPLILTSGLLSQNKGIESLLKVLPEVINQYPDLVYLILGATHPMIKKKYGEAYRQYLKSIVSELEIENRVVFHDKFVEKEELCNYILASDIYASPYLSREQIVSGTLTYAIGMGKAIVSTPFHSLLVCGGNAF